MVCFIDGDFFGLVLFFIVVNYIKIYELVFYENKY